MIRAKLSWLLLLLLLLSSKLSIRPDEGLTTALQSFAVIQLIPYQLLRIFQFFSSFVTPPT